MNNRNARLVRGHFQGIVFLLGGHTDYITYAYCSKCSSIFDNFIFIRQLKTTQAKFIIGYADFADFRYYLEKSFITDGAE